MDGTLLAALHGALLAAFALWTLLVAPDGRARIRRLPWLLAAVLVPLALLTIVEGRWLPLETLTPLREGGTDVQIRVARAEGGGLSRVHMVLYMPWLVGGLRSLDALVPMQMALTSAAAVLMIPMLRRAAGTWTGGGLVWFAWLTSLPAHGAALGAGPGPAAWPWLAVGGMALAGWVTGRTKVARWGGLVLALAACGPLILLREELSLLLLSGVTVGALHHLGVGERIASFHTDHRRAWVLTALGVCAVGVLTWSATAARLPAMGQGAWVVQALHPMDRSILTLWPILGSMVAPGLLLLAVRGGVVAPARNLGLGLAVLFLLRLYHAAAHADLLGGDEAWPLEMMRYVALLSPALAALAAWGWGALPRGWPRWVAGVLLLLSPVPQLWPRQAEGMPTEPMWTRWGDMDLDNQREVRFLVLAQRIHADCGFVAPLPPSGDGPRPWVAWRSTWGVDEAQLRRMIPVHEGGRAAAVAAVPGSPACVLVYTGLTCALDPGPDCDTEGLEPVRRRRWEPAPHAHPDHGWNPAEPYELGLWRVEQHEDGDEGP